VRRGHPTHELAQVAILSRPQHDMPVIRHQAIGQYPHRYVGERVSQYALERAVVLIVVEDLRAGVASIQDVKEYAA
jgi:hypothetical protein